MSRTFHYIKIYDQDRRYFCLEQHAGWVAWQLFVHSNPVVPPRRSSLPPVSLKELKKRLVKEVGRFRWNCVFLARFISHKYKLIKNDQVVRLPVYGHMCVPVHRGFRVFDFRRKRVRKVFDADVSALEGLCEIQRLQAVSSIDFASTLKTYDADGKWYEEEYLKGTLQSFYEPMNSAELLGLFTDQIISCLTSLMMHERPIQTLSYDYCVKMIDEIDFQTFSRKGGQKAELEEIRWFLDEVVEKIPREEHSTIFLVFTHGDFCPANLLETSEGIKVIDWEGAGFRSALFDFYSYFFYRPTCREVPVNVLVAELQEAFPLFISEFGKKDPEFSRSLKTGENSYRWIFYIEMVCRLVSRAMTDKNLHVMKYLREYIKAFNHYEELLSGKAT